MTAREVAPYPLMRLVIFFALIAGVFTVFKPFLIAIVWAVVITVTAWPVNIYLRRKIAYRSETLAAGCMTILMIFIFLGVVIPFSFELAGEISRLVVVTRASLTSNDIILPEVISRFSWLDEYIRPLLAGNTKAKEELFQTLEEYQPQMLSAISIAARGIWALIFELGVIIFSSYFFFRYGDVLSRQLISVSQHLGGVHYVELIQTAWSTVQGVVYGVVGAAISQGILAGIGFYACGVSLPLLLGMVTTILGLVPFGPPILYLPVAGFLLMSGAPWYYGVGLLVWGIAVVSTVDNIVRPIFISQTTKLPILLAFFGGIGGISAFGMVGLFVGPVLLALAQAVWLGLAKANPELEQRTL
jgi:Ca2+-transporting ATPase